MTSTDRTSPTSPGRASDSNSPPTLRRASLSALASPGWFAHTFCIALFHGVERFVVERQGLLGNGEGLRAERRVPIRGARFGDESSEKPLPHVAEQELRDRKTSHLRSRYASHAGFGVQAFFEIVGES